MAKGKGWGRGLRLKDRTRGKGARWWGGGLGEGGGERAWVRGALVL